MFISHDILSILRRHHISKALIFLQSAIVIVHDFTGVSSDWENQGLHKTGLGIFSYSSVFQMFDNFIISDLAIAVRLLISVLHPPSFVMTAPRKLKSDIFSTSCPSQ